MKTPQPFQDLCEYDELARHSFSGSFITWFSQLIFECALQMFLKNDAMSLMKHTDSHLYPTIPSALLFLLHVQQQEIGSFKLANDMVKWSKIR